MTTNLSARVMAVVDGQEQEVRFHVRSVAMGSKPFRRDGGASEGDAWEAYQETSLFVDLGAEGAECLMRVEGLSDAPRATPEEAARDMWREVAKLVAKPGYRLTRGEMPEDLT